MPERTRRDPGVPIWVDLGAADPEAAKRFYGSLFGWEAEDAGPVEETGGYAFFKLDGKMVAGVGPLMSEDQPVAWSTYIATDDADALAERVTAAGGSVLAAPMDIADSGRMAFFFHPAVGMIGAWQSRSHTGTEIVDDPGSLTWNELHTRDVAGAKEFGSKVFGWGMDDQEMGGMTYTVVRVGEDGVAGMMEMPPGVPDEVPAYWVTIFAVADCDASLAKLKELGGTITYGPSDMEGVGRFAFVEDPQGAGFGVLQNET